MVAELNLHQVAGRYAPRLLYPAELSRYGVLTWRARMVNEYLSASVFEALAAQLQGAGFDSNRVDECLGFAEEERTHGVLCGAVVVALGGDAKAPIGERPPFPLHSDAPPRAAALRNLIHICCMSETVAVALIGAERLEMPDGPLRELLTRIYSDEVGHARFGWRLLEEHGPALEAQERLAVERYLPTAFAHLEAHELAHIPDCDAPPKGAVLGLCSGREARRLLYETMDEVIRPGLRRWFRC
ncbi:MAG TPA: ferritin-like domain-containing protein [Polyangiaceae bacterium]|jgi:hypothetical protein